MKKLIVAFRNYVNEPKISFQDIFLFIEVSLRVNSAYNTRRCAAKIIWKCVRQIQT
jgi:hypothetical protein